MANDALFMNKQNSAKLNGDVSKICYECFQGNRGVHLMRPCFHQVAIPFENGIVPQSHFIHAPTLTLIT